MASDDLAAGQAQCTRSVCGASGKQQRAGRGHFVGYQHAAALVAHARRIFGPAQLFQRVQACIAIGPNGQRNTSGQQFSVGRDAIAQIALGCGTDTNGAATSSQQLDLNRVSVRGMHNSSMLVQRSKAL